MLCGEQEGDTAMYLSMGLSFGVVAGLLTNQLVLGITFGVLAGVLLDGMKANGKNPNA
jgi:hypothetical protein